MIEPLLQNRLTCLRALLSSESGFSRASLPFFSSSDLPTWGLTCLGALLLSEPAANSLFLQRSFFSYLLGSLQGTDHHFKKQCKPTQDGPSLAMPVALMALPV